MCYAWNERDCCFACTYRHACIRFGNDHRILRCPMWLWGERDIKPLETKIMPRASSDRKRPLVSQTFNRTHIAGTHSIPYFKTVIIIIVKIIADELFLIIVWQLPGAGKCCVCVLAGENTLDLQGKYVYLNNLCKISTSRYSGSTNAIVGYIQPPESIRVRVRTQWPPK